MSAQKRTVITSRRRQTKDRRSAATNPKPGSRHWLEPVDTARHLYFDLGANKGVTVGKWLAGKSNCKLWAWEPNPQVFKELDKTFGKRDQVVELHNAAVGVEEGTTNIFLGVQSSYSTTCLESKIDSRWQVDKEHPIEVPMFDWPTWLQENVLDTGMYKDGRVVLKMDVEGLEYQILQKMIEMDQIRYIDELRVEYHLEKFSDFGVEDPKAIEDHLDGCCNVIRWA